jgi:hypothetical protein
MLRCSTAMPFGSPEEPEVYIMYARSCGAPFPVNARAVSAAIFDASTSKEITRAGPEGSRSRNALVVRMIRASTSCVMKPRRRFG